MTYSTLPRKWIYSPLLNDHPLFDTQTRWHDWNPAIGQTAMNFAVDINEDDQQIEILADLPGLTEDELELTLNKNVLTIKAERNETNKSTKEDKVIRTERRFGKFQRSLRLPDSVNTDKVTAHLDKGVLQLRIPKLEAEQPRRIAIQTAA